MLADYIARSKAPVRYTIVVGRRLGVSASSWQTEEYPDLDVTTRGAMSLGRRLQDPLAELIEDPAPGHRRGSTNTTSTGRRSSALTGVVENVVNRDVERESTPPARAC